jgi:hypothetical protein
MRDSAMPITRENGPVQGFEARKILAIRKEIKGYKNQLDMDIILSK